MHTHNFKDVVELVTESGGREIEAHLLTAPKNATYLSSQYIKMIQVMADYVKKPLHNILKTCNFSFYSDEAMNITSTEQFAVYAMFCFNNVVSEHFIGLIPISKVIGSSLSALNVIEALEQFFIKQDISSWDARLFISP